MRSVTSVLTNWASSRRPFLWFLLTVLCAAIALILVYVLGVQTPFEWDEILFARAVEHYDAAANSPHMPGYPVFVLAARLVSFGVPDAVRAVQITSLTAAFLTLALVFFLGRRLGLTVLQACGGLFLLAGCPSFLWFAGVGLSDISGALSSCAVLWAILQDRAPIRSAVLAGFLAAIAVGVRSQAIYFLVPMVVVALFEWRVDRLRRVLAATAATVVTSFGIWFPAVFLTGPGRWWSAFVWQFQWVRQEQTHGLALPFAPMSWIVQGWLIRPFGTPWLAAGFWALVLCGAGVFWHGGRRRLVVYGLGIGLVSLMLAAFSLDLRDGPRYILPSLVFFSLIAGGGIGVARWQERLMTGAAAVFVVASVVWISPGLALRRSEPAPVIDVLERVLESASPTDVVVFYEDKLWPHVYWMLERRGFEIYPIGDLHDWSQDHQGESRSMVSVFSNRSPLPEQASFEAAWDSPQVRAMTRGRYLRCWAVIGETGD